MEKKRILVISTSLRKNGNSETLAEAFIKGANEKGHLVNKVSLVNQDIQFCKGCLVCQSQHQCIIKDDVNAIIELMKNADVLVFATPIYFYEMSGQMKTLLDRTNPLFGTEYAFRDIYLLTTAADENESSMDGVTKGLSGWIDCFEKATLKAVVKGVGIDKYGAIKDAQDLLDKAYLLGKNV